MLLVFGSINVDMAFDAEVLPQAGETVMGNGYRISPGGKGANQAHAARLDGSATTLVGAVGNDAMAEMALQALTTAKVDLSHIQRLNGQTGCAAIVVDGQGENQIVVAPGVNLAARADHVSEDVLAKANVLLLQMETDYSQNTALALRARQLGCPVVLNNAPAKPLGVDLLQALDVLIVNQSELTMTTQILGIRASDPGVLVQTLAQRFSFNVVLTLGGQGLIACQPGQLPLMLPALIVPVVDTTGAGDTFSGVFAAALVRHQSFEQALMRGLVAAGLSCMRPGAQLGQPNFKDIDAALAAYQTLHRIER
jgi:ribokinase